MICTDIQQPSNHAQAFFIKSSPYPELYTHTNRGPFATFQDFVSAIESFDIPDPTVLLYAIIDKTWPPSPESSLGALAGLAGYLSASPDHLSIELSILTLPSFQRTHVTSNAIGLLLQHALDSPRDGGLGLRRVYWESSSANSASQKVAERMGFVKEGVKRWDQVYRGGSTKGKIGNGRSLPTHGADGDLGRDTVVLSVCWDDWESGTKEQVQTTMDRQ